MEFVEEPRWFDIASDSSCMAEVRLLTRAENILFTAFRPITIHPALYLTSSGGSALGIRKCPLASI
jgi:hypothetical protein